MFKNNHSDPLEHKALERNASGNCCAFDLQKQGYLALLPHIDKHWHSTISVSDLETRSTPKLLRLLKWSKHRSKNEIALKLNKIIISDYNLFDQVVKHHLSPLKRWKKTKL